MQTKAEKLNLKPTVYQQEMDKLSLPRKYQTILVPSSSFQLLLDESLPSIAIKLFFDHLSPGGVLAMPFMTLWKHGDPFESEWATEVTRPADGALVRRIAWSHFNPETNMEDTRDTWQVIKDGQVIESEVHEQAPATLSYTQAEAIALFEQTGFKEIHIFSGFTFNPVKPDDVLFSVLGKKP